MNSSAVSTFSHTFADRVKPDRHSLMPVLANSVGHTEGEPFPWKLTLLPDFYSEQGGFKEAYGVLCCLCLCWVLLCFVVI